MKQTKAVVCSSVEAGEEEAEGPGDRVLHRRRQGVFQYWQLQLPHGHHL